MSKHEFFITSESKTKANSEFKQGFIKGHTNLIKTPQKNLEKLKKDSPFSPSEQEKKVVKFFENSLEKKTLPNPKSPILSSEEYQKKLSEEKSRYENQNQTLFKSNQFFLQKRKEKNMERLKKDSFYNNEKEELQEQELTDEKQSCEDLIEVKRGKLDPIFHRASITVQTDENTANLEEFREFEREKYEGNKVMVEWLNKNKNSLEKSQRIEPILKKKNDQYFAMEEFEKRALKKIEEKITSYVFRSKNEMGEFNQEEKKQKVKEEAKNQNEKIDNDKHDKTTKNQIIDNLKEKKQKDETVKKQKDDKLKVIEKKPLKFHNKKTIIIGTKNCNLNHEIESPESRKEANANYNKMDIKRSKTPTYEKEQIRHKNLVLRAKTPEYQKNSDVKYFVSAKKIISQKNEQIININEKNVLDNYTDDKFFQISKVYDDSLIEITVKSLQVFFV